MKWYLMVLKNYVGFSGRARRKEYWMFLLFNMIFGIGAKIIDLIFGTSDVIPNNGLFYSLYSLALFLPSFAVSVRRLHDVGKSGWLLLAIFVPVVMLSVFVSAMGNTGNSMNSIWTILLALAVFGIAIWLLVLMCTDSESEPNNWGPNPKEVDPTVSYGVRDTSTLDGDIRV
jgi:uncharacterized membrane protein YhaH (DUF805 family)